MTRVHGLGAKGQETGTAGVEGRAGEERRRRKKVKKKQKTGVADHGKREM